MKNLSEVALLISICAWKCLTVASDCVCSDKETCCYYPCDELILNPEQTQIDQKGNCGFKCYDGLVPDLNGIYHTQLYFMNAPRYWADHKNYAYDDPNGPMKIEGPDKNMYNRCFNQCFAESSNSGELLDAIDDITGHVDGTKILSRTELACAAKSFTKNAAVIGTTDELLSAPLDLVDLYEEKNGALFLNQKTRYGFKRVSDTDDFYLERVIVDVQQTILDRAYSATISDDSLGSQPLNAIVNYPAVPRYWQTSKYFPGYVEPGQSKTHTVQIQAINAETWPPERRTCFDRGPHIRTTGLYLPPGGIAIVRVPNEIVGRGYEIRVGANDSNLKYHGFYKRMDRVTSTFPVVAKETTIASPLGGGIYIRVPYLADDGIIDVQIIGPVVQAPIFSMSSLRTTNKEEWNNSLRNAPAPWADFETDKFLMQVPSLWIAKYDFDHLKQLAKDRDAAMDGVTYFMGLKPSERNNYVLYVQPDMQIRSSGGYGVGYPQVNHVLTSGENGIDDTSNKFAMSLYLETPYYDWDIGYHELGHCSIPSFYRGEGEALVNLPYAYINNAVAGMGFDKAFRKSFNSGARFTPDRTAVDWMIRENFRVGNEMSYSQNEDDEFRYQQKGYARYADIARLFGWDTIHDFWRQEHLDSVSDNASAGDELDIVDSRTLRLSIAAGVDLTPLIHFWGIHPVDGSALKNLVQDYNLEPSTKVHNLLKKYVTLIPEDRSGFDAHHEAVFPGRPPDCQSPKFGCGFYNKMKELWDVTYYDSTKSALLDIINLYYDDNVTTCSQDNDAEFLSTSRKVKTCDWLSKQSQNKQVEICKNKTRYSTTLEPAENVCEETCNSCDECYENPKSFFFLKFKKGKPKYKKCQWLLKKKNYAKKFCKKDDSNEGRGPPKEVCPETCSKETSCLR